MSQPWTFDEQEALIAMRDAWRSYAEIAAVVGRSVNACYQQHCIMGGEAPTRPGREPSPRRCLKCGTEFVSDTYRLCYEHRKQARDSGYCFDVA